MRIWENTLGSKVTVKYSQKGVKRMETNTVVILVLGVMTIMVALVTLMVKLVELGRK